MLSDSCQAPPPVKPFLGALQSCEALKMRQFRVRFALRWGFAHLPTAPYRGKGGAFPADGFVLLRFSKREFFMPEEAAGLVRSIPQAIFPVAGMAAVMCYRHDIDNIIIEHIQNTVRVTMQTL